MWYSTGILECVTARDSGGGPAAPSEKSLIEQLAGRCVAFTLGPRFEFRHTGDASDMVDGYLVDEGRIAIAVEVTVAANEVVREFNAAIEDDPDGLRLPLRPGSGRWIALLDPSAYSDVFEHPVRSFRTRLGVIDGRAAAVTVVRSGPLNSPPSRSS